MLKSLILSTMLAVSASAAFARSADCDMAARAHYINPLPLETNMPHFPGTLLRVPECADMDFRYLPDMSKSTAYVRGPNAAPIVLQARFVWDGAAGQEITTGQHVVVAYTQRGVENSMQNTWGQKLWTHGAGAILGQFGLGLEIWRRDDANAPGYGDDPANAVVWTQLNNRCAQDVLGTIPPGSMCLPATPNTWGYLTPAPGFTLRRGVAYWLRFKLSPSSLGYTSLYADLLEETASGAVLVQSGLIGFPTATYFPIAGQALEATVARTPGSAAEPVIHYDAFDFGF